MMKDVRNRVCLSKPEGGSAIKHCSGGSVTGVLTV